MSMYRSHYTKPRPIKLQTHQRTLPANDDVKTQPKYVSTATIQMGANSRNTSNKLSDSTSSTSSSPRRSVVSDSTFTSSPGRNKSRESLSAELLKPVTKRPVEGTPRTSTPEPPKVVSPRIEKQYVSGMNGLDETDSGYFKGGFKREDVHFDSRKLFQDSSASSDVESTSDHDQPGSSRALPSAGPRSHRDEFAKNNWYFDIRQKLEDLSWSYQTLETEYSFLDKLMQEQKKDLQKAKSWAKHLKAQSSPNRAGNVYYS